jgi:two-component system CheB/CheR fusion protein
VLDDCRKRADTHEGRLKKSGGSRRVPLIVGVGASAGGLEAFTQLLQHLSADTGMAFVLVQHLDPARDSALSELLSKATSLPVREVTDGLPVAPNHIYVIPPNRGLSIARGVLKLRPRPATGGALRSIDSFLEALASDQGDRAIGVILSGTATDGTLGLEAIKAGGGITFAQGDSARFDSMPRSAIAAGCVDFVLDPGEIARELDRIAKHPLVGGRAALPKGGRASATARGDDAAVLPTGGGGTPRKRGRRAGAEAEAASGNAADDGYARIMLLLRNHRGVDFSLYKTTTIRRRIARRMVLNRQETLPEYGRFLRGNGNELDALYADVLISVTSFFRNPETFDVLKGKVFPKLLQQRGDDPIRVWVPGCSTGQEAYSIAMAFVEAAEKAPRRRKLQMFATDLNEALLEKARNGLYARSLAQDVSPERLRRFFVEEEGGYRVGKPLREMIVFARQNLIADPPFSRMDLVSCRNLLIYLEPSLQKNAMRVFHYALEPLGFLLLGASESVGGFSDLFEPMDRKHKLYSRKAASASAPRLPAGEQRGERPPSARRRMAVPLPATSGQGEPEGFRGELSSQREADRITVNRYAPPGVLVSAEMQILQFRGPTGAYLEPPVGKASFDLLKMAREGLMLPLRAAINKAKKENRAARKDNVRFQQDGEARTVNVEVIPLKNLKERCFLILFDDAGKSGRAARSPAAPGRPGGERARTAPPGRLGKREESRQVADLEQELVETRGYLQSVQEQHEAASEELQASNEEIQSANEELQSTNEELETSKEELESTNEELSTVNEEMANRNTELNRLNSDLFNLQSSTKLAIVLLGRDLTVRRFTAEAGRQFNLLSSDVGRPIGDVRHNLDLTDLETIITEVIDTVRECEREVRDRSGRWYSLRVRPYLTLDNQLDGAVLVLVDIDALKRAELRVAEARKHAEAIIDTVPDPLLVLHGDLRIRAANAAFYRVFRLSPAETEGRSISELDRGAWNIPGLRQALEDIIPHDSSFADFKVIADFERIGRRAMLLNARTLREAGDRPRLVLLGIRDITDREQAAEEVRESERRLREMIDALPAAIYTTDAEGRITHFNPAAVELSGRRPEPGTDRWCVSEKLYHPDGRPMPHDEGPMAIALKENSAERGAEIILERPDGPIRS